MGSLTQRWPVAVVLLALAAAAATPAAASLASESGRRWQAEAPPQAGPSGQAGHQPEAARVGEPGEPEAGGHEGGWVWPLIARLVNFGIMAGTLVYFLRTPFATYLQNRSTQIRRDLVEAEALRQSAAEQLAAIEQRLKALPGEIERLRQQGAEEIAVEEARIRAAADAERERLTEQARREIELQVRIATLELRREAAALAVGLAAERIKKNLTPEIHLRLIDRYADQVKESRTLHD